MLATLTLLGLLAAFVGVWSLLRTRPGKAHPVFQQNGIFAVQLSESLLHALVSDRGYLRSDTRIAGFEGTAALVDRDGACGRLVICPSPGFGRESDLGVFRSLASRHASDRATTLVAVGGGEEFGKALFEATGPVRTLHIDDQGRVREVRAGLRSGAPKLVVENALDRMAEDLRHGSLPALGFETARSLAFDELEPPRRPGTPLHGVVTTALTVAIVACFLVQVAISRDSLQGDGAALAVAYRMGAIHQPAILGGEWQRLIAAAFLHFGLLHLGMNGWAQWSLGGPIEYLVGSWRFLALWVGSALGASLTSLMFNESSVAAGASGAIFGLLGAFTTFVFFRKDVLPQPVPRSLRNGVLATLLLNLMISFIPSIDMAAHVGGFLTGALMAFGLVGRDRGTPSPSVRPGPFRLAVLGLVLVGVGLTSVQERADLSLRPPKVGGDYRLEELHLPIPDGFVVSKTQTPGLITLAADGGPGSPFTVTYRVSEPQADEASASKLLESLHPQGGAESAESDWIALSRFGVQNFRAIEITVVAPRSSRADVEALGADLARLVR